VEQRVDLRQQHGQCIALAQRTQHARRRSRRQAARQFAPDDVGREIGQLACSHLFVHQVQ
jgi:hypothetical protein